MKVSTRIKSDLKKYLLHRLSEADDVEVTSAHKLSTTEVEKILHSVGVDRTVKPELSVDPKLLAGVVVRRGSRVIDMSLAGMVNGLKHKIDL